MYSEIARSKRFATTSSRIVARVVPGCAIAAEARTLVSRTARIIWLTESVLPVLAQHASEHEPQQPLCSFLPQSPPGARPQTPPASPRAHRQARLAAHPGGLVPQDPAVTRLPQLGSRFAR